MNSVVYVIGKFNKEFFEFLHVYNNDLKCLNEITDRDTDRQTKNERHKDVLFKILFLK